MLGIQHFHYILLKYFLLVTLKVTSNFKWPFFWVPYWIHENTLSIYPQFTLVENDNPFSWRKTRITPATYLDPLKVEGHCCESVKTIFTVPLAWSLIASFNSWFKTFSLYILIQGCKYSGPGAGGTTRMRITNRTTSHLLVFSYSVGVPW